MEQESRIMIRPHDSWLSADHEAICTIEPYWNDPWTDTRKLLLRRELSEPNRSKQTDVQQ